MNYVELRKAPSALFGQGATVAEVEAAQQRLGVRFPTDLVQFLLEVGWGSVGDSEVCGLGPDVPDFLHLVKTVELERDRIPPHLVPLVNDGFGNFFCSDTRNGAVVLWDHESEQLQPVASSFDQWLEETARAA